MDFSATFSALKTGQRAQRASWAPGQYVAYHPGYPAGMPVDKATAQATGITEQQVRAVRPFLLLCTPDALTVWTPALPDLLADDWTTTPPDNSGGFAPPADPSRWQPLFGDTFDTDISLGQFTEASTRGRWGAYPDGWNDTSKLGTYSPSKTVSVRNGNLDIWMRADNGAYLVAALVPKINGPGRSDTQIYGRYAVRFRTDRLPGYKIAWLLWPESDRWDDGEIDFPEADLDGSPITAYSHQIGSPRDQDEFRTTASTLDWHTTVIEWTPEQIRYELDGREIGRTTNPQRIPRTPMRWVIQCETALTGRRPAAKTSGHILIDQVAVWAWRGPRPTTR